MTPPVREAARVLLLSSFDKLLLTQADEGFWYPVGGGIEPGESIEDAAIRELWGALLHKSGYPDCIELWFAFLGVLMAHTLKG